VIENAKKFQSILRIKKENEKVKLCVHIGYWLLSGVWHYGEIWGGGEMGSNYILLGFVCPTFLPFSAFHFYSFFLIFLSTSREIFHFTFVVCLLASFVVVCLMFPVCSELRFGNISVSIESRIGDFST